MPLNTFEAVALAWVPRQEANGWIQFYREDGSCAGALHLWPPATLRAHYIKARGRVRSLETSEDDLNLWLNRLQYFARGLRAIECKDRLKLPAIDHEGLIAD